jgi:hypothetical protein
MRIKLESSPLVETPMWLSHAIVGYRSRRNRASLLTQAKGFTDGVPGDWDSVWDRMLSGEIPYTVDGSSFYFDVQV